MEKAASGQRRRTDRGVLRSELVQRISKRQAGLTREDVAVAVDIILEGISEHLKRGGRIEIRGFGTFATRARRARIGRNPKTGKSVNVPVRRVPRFSASTLLLSVSIGTKPHDPTRSPVLRGKPIRGAQHE